MFEMIITTIVSFIGTNIDDILINTFFFTQAQTKKEIRLIIIGKYIGIGTLVLISLTGALGLQFLPRQYIFLLGLIPISLGIKELIFNIKKPSSTNEYDKTSSSGTNKLILTVIFLTLANGADNIAVYIPLFSSYTIVQMIAVIIIFAFMTALWCILGNKLSRLLFLQRILLKYKHIIVPFVFIFLGVYIMLKGIF
ncbi:MAG: cadmium resistance transporter [Clostridia bacterium]|nr:cadmium resistance transporter [Clostridia bacterium]